MTDTKKLCPNCKKGILENKIVPQYLHIEGAPEFKVERFSVGICTSCESEVMSLSDSVKLDKLFLEQLIQYYSKKPWDVPGKAASWMRKVINMTARDLAGLAKVEESTLSHTFKKNTTLDRFAATILIIKSRDFLNGNAAGNEIIKKLDDPDSFVQPLVPISEIVRLVKISQPVSLGNARRKARTQNSSREKKATSQSLFNPKLYSKYLGKPLKTKRVGK